VCAHGLAGPAVLVGCNERVLIVHAFQGSRGRSQSIPAVATVDSRLERAALPSAIAVISHRRISLCSCLPSDIRFRRVRCLVSDSN